MKKRILVIYARYGSGHKTIAEYISKYIEENNKNMEVLLLDLTPYANWLGRVSIKVMDFVAKNRPEFIFNTCYEATDHKFTSIQHNKFAKMSYDNRELRKKIRDFNPDVTIATHFYGSNIISYYNDLKLTHSKIYTVITDYHTHLVWTKNHQKITGFIVGNEIVKKELIEEGISSKKIFNFGLPLNINQIRNLDSREEILKRYKLKGDKRIFLFFGGSSTGSMYYYDFFKKAIQAEVNADIIFISGKNERLKKKCEKYVRKKKANNVKVLGFSKDVLNLMKISDLVISKPGGATVTECLEMHVPMLLIPGVGGQEKYNARFLVKKRFGIKVRGKNRFKRILQMVIKYPKIIDRMHDNLLRLDKNKSVERINDLVKKA